MKGKESLGGSVDTHDSEVLLIRLIICERFNRIFHHPQFAFCPCDGHPVTLVFIRFLCQNM